MNSVNTLLNAYRRAQGHPSALHPGETASAGVDVGSSEKLGALIQRHGLWSGMIRHFWGKTLPYAALGLGVIVAGPAIPWTMDATISTIGAAGDGRDVIVSAVLLSLAAAVFTLFRWASTWQIRMLGYKIELSMQRLIFRRLQRIDPNWLSEKGKSSSTYLQEYPRQLAQLGYLIEFVIYSLLLLAYAALLVGWFGVAGIVVLCFIAVGTACSRWLIERSNHLVKDYLDGDHRRSALIDILISAWMPLRRHHLEHVIANKTLDIRKAQVRCLRRDATRSAWSQMLTQALPQFVVWAAAGSALFLSAGMSAGQGIALLVLVRLLLTAVTENLITYSTLHFGGLIGAEISELLRDTKPIEDPHDERLPEGAVTISSDDTDSSPQINIAAGSRVAVLGSDDAGASALVERISGLHNAMSHLASEHGGDAVLVQRGQPMLDGTIGDFVTLWQKPSSRVRYRDALVHSGALDDLAQRKDGDASELSSTTIRLSEGQTVRLGLAQALMQAPDILLLDDVFAPLDPTRAQQVAASVLSADCRSTTRIFYTTRMEILSHCDSIVVVDGGFLVHIDRAEVGAHQEDLTRILGAEQYSQLVAAVSQLPRLSHETPLTNDGMQYSFEDGYTPPPIGSFEASVARPRMKDLWRNVRGIFPSWAIAVLPIILTATIAADYTVATIVDKGVRDWQTWGFLGAFILASASITWLGRKLSMDTPISGIDRVYTGILYRVMNGDIDRDHSSAAGRIGRDFYSLEFSVPPQLVRFATAWITVLCAGIIVAASGVVTLIPLAILAIAGAWSYRRSRTAIVSAVQLSAASRGPMLNFARNALGVKAYHVSPGLRGAVSARFDDLADVRMAGVLRLAWVRLRTLLTVELLGLCVFLIALWASVATRGTGVLAAGVIVYAAYTFSQQIASLVEDMQEMDDTLLSIGRIASLLGKRTLPRRSVAARSIPDTPSAMLTQLLRPQNEVSVDDEQSVLQAVEVRAAMPKDVAAPDPFSLAVGPGRFVVLSGPSGVGKSTLLQTLAGARPCSEGSLRIAQYVPDILGQETRQHARYVESDLPRLPVSVHELFGPAPVDGLRLIDQLLREAKLAPIDTSSRLWELDQVYRQIVGMAHAFKDRPSIVFCDESTSAMSTSVERTVFTQLRSYSPNTAIVAVLHRVDNQTLADECIRIDSPVVDHASYPQL